MEHGTLSMGTWDMCMGVWDCFYKSMVWKYESLSMEVGVFLLVHGCHVWAWKYANLCMGVWDSGYGCMRVCVWGPWNL